MKTPHNEIQLPKLNYPEYEFKFRNESGFYTIFDAIRNKYVALTPEEWVRQNTIKYLHHVKGYPNGLLSIEKEFILNKLKKRSDIVAFNNSGAPLLIVECKSTNIPITQHVFNQAVRYNLVLNAKAIFVTNGIKHHYCLIENKTIRIITELPSYSELK